MTNLNESKFFNSLAGGIQTESSFVDVETGIRQNVMLWDINEFPEAYNYISYNLIFFGKLQTVTDSILLAEKLIDNVENISKTTNVSRSDLLKYFVRNWIGNYVTVYEAALQLINKVFELVDNKKIAKKIEIEKNEIFKNDKLLSELQKVTLNLVSSKMSSSDNLLAVNNKIKHQGSFEHKEIDELNSQEFWRDFGIDDEKEEIDFEIDKGLVKLKILRDIKKRNKEIVESIFNLTDYLNEVFEERFEEKRRGHKNSKK